jgi:hypothetical protein
VGTLVQVKQHDYGQALIVDFNYRTATLNLATIIDYATPVVFIMTLQDATTPTINRAPAAVTDVDAVNKTVTVTYNWASGDTATVGTYRGEFEFTLTGGPATAPTGGYLIIRIADDLG